MRTLGIVASLLLAGSAWATVSPPFVETNVVTIQGDPQATSMAWAPDNSGRLFVTGKRGAIYIVKDGVVLPDPAYRFVARDDEPTGELVTSSECGLLAIAFDPAFADNGYIYVFATLHVPATSNDIEQQIIRFTMQGNTATDRTTLIAGLRSTGDNHDGGSLAFGPDGLLYWGVGNLGNGEGQGTDLTSSAAKIGRASPVPGAPAPDGPYNDGAGPNYDFIYARSVRNPYTMTFHPVTGIPWVNIVGDGWEQIFALALGDHTGYPSENAEPGTNGATVAPIIAYRTGTSPEIGIGANAAVRANNVVTVTTDGAHGLRKGGQITIVGIDNTSFNGTFHVASVPTPTSVTYAQTAANATSGSGAVVGADYGNVVLGGTFYDATQFPAEYRQNFFFGDFGSGQIARVETASDNSVARVTQFGTNISSHIDASTGPDGALWLVNHVGTVRRISYAATAQGIVVSPQNLRVREGSRGFVAVSLAQAPTADVTVSLARTQGTTQVTVPAATATFTPANWNVPQYIEVTASADDNLVEDTAQLDATATGLGTEAVTVRVTDAFEPGAGPDGPPIDTDGSPSSTDDGGCCRVGSRANGFAAGLLAFAVLATLRRRRTR